MTTTSRITLTAAEKIAFNRFMSEVAPKLEANSTGSVATLTAEEVLLAVQGLSISALYKAEAEGLTIEVARDIVFGSVYNGLDAATQALLLEAVEVAVTPDTSASDSPTAPGNLAKGLDLIGQIITKSGSIISKAFSAAFSKVSSILTSLFNWSAAQVKAVATHVQTVTLPWAQRTSIAIWDWTSQSIMTISRAAWKCIRAVAGAVKAVLNTIFKAILSVLTTIDTCLGKMMPPSAIKQAVILTKACNITAAHTVISSIVGSTYIMVDIITKADLTLLRAEIAGCGDFV